MAGSNRTDHADYQRLYRAAWALSDSEARAVELVERAVGLVRRRHGADALALALIRLHLDAGIGEQEPAACNTAAFELDGPGGTTVDEVAAAYQAVRQLAPPARLAVVAVDILGLEPRRAARALGVRRGALQATLRTARGAIADELARPVLELAV